MRRVEPRSKNLIRRALSLLTLLAFLPTLATAQRLPLKIFTTADGLSGNSISRIVRDSRGFLWFCTEEGLSRFDGYNFISYGTGQGLPQPSVNDLLETRAGEYWVATNGGLVHFNPRGTPTNRVVYANDAGNNPPSMFTVIVPDDSDRHARAITSLLESRDGTIWCGTYKGLYKLDVAGDRPKLLPVEVGMPTEYGEYRNVNRLAQDTSGSLWIATQSGLYRRWPDGSAAHYMKRDGLPDDIVQDLLINHLGQLWVGSRYAGFYRLSFDETHAKPTVATTVTPGGLSQGGWINQLFESSDHKLWAATPVGLLEYLPSEGTDGKPFRVYTPKNGLSDHNINALAEDTGGNLWLGAGQGGGAMKLARSGFITYDEKDGVTAVDSIFPDRAGGVCLRGYVLGDKQASIFDGGKIDLLNLSDASYLMRFGRFDGKHMTWFLPAGVSGKYLGWVGEGVTLQARHTGDWWFANGLYHFPSADNFTEIKNLQPLAYYGKDSLVGNRQIWRLFEDSRDRIWISIIDTAGNGLVFWDPSTQSLRDLTSAANLPSLHDDLPRSFVEDRAGNVWIGFNTGLARFNQGVFTFFTARDGVPAGGIVAMHTDRDGRLWMASSRTGLIRVDDPTAAHPVFTTYTTEQGLSGNVTSAVTQDLYGRIYVGTGQGLDRLDPTTGRVKHYTTADGLAGGRILAAFLASDGWLWIGTSHGMSRFLPEPEHASAAPPALITAVKVAGTSQNVSALGETDWHLADLSYDSSQLQIDFVGLAFAPGESLNYQYKLDGADRDWSPPTTQRSVTYARLASGRYRFLIRAVNSDGEVSTAPASITFRILPPIWLRWWFITIAILILACAAYLLYRYRVSRLLEVANMRTRIATDLHDDIGSNLTKIAILSEVAKQQHGNGDKEESPLTSIAQISRESVAAMSDIVWAINPKRDHLIDVVRRMRRHAEELCSARDIYLTFTAPGEEQNLRLGVDVRRDLFLVFKEAINNSARHAQCSHIDIHLTVDSTALSLEIQDNGIGFDATRESEGQGMASMQRRAQELGGSLNIETRAGEGTTVRLKVPLAHTRTFAWR